MPDLRAGRALARGAGLMVAAAFSCPQAVFASCSNNYPISDSSILCTGSDTSGVSAPFTENVAVTIDTGANITTGDTPAIQLGAGANVKNFGTLNSGATFTVQLSDGDDQLLNSGTISGAVHLGNGDNRIELDGGRIGTYLISGNGDDALDWRGGLVGKSIQLGDGDDSAALSSATGVGGTFVNAGYGNDSLVFVHQKLDDITAFYNWENIRLSEETQLTLNNSFILGGEDALPAQLVIDNGSSLLVPEFNVGVDTLAGQALRLENNGVIDLRGATANRLTIRGDYTGRGRIYLDAELGGDDSLADRLVIDGGRASGSSELVINAFDGRDLTTERGILVVESRNGGSTDTGAFYMAEPVSSGPYDYYLFRGSDAAEDADNWYLRSNLLPGSAPPSTEPAAATTLLSSSDTATPQAQSQALAVVPADGKPIPLYRPEIPLYSQLKSLAQQLSLQQISSYQQSRGEQRNASSGAYNGWLRLYHRPVQLNWGGDMDSRFDGTMSGLQLNGNLYAGPTCHGSQELGLFAGSSIARGDVTGLARGEADYRAGSNSIDSHYIGLYFTDYRNDQSYLDLLFKIAFVSAKSRSSRGIDTSTSGPQLSLSIEKGFTLPVSEYFHLEPQLQTTANYTNLGGIDDGVSWVELDMTPELSFRAGLRAYNTRGDNQYYLFGNLWHTWHGHDELLFDNRLFLENQRRATWGEVGAGMDLLQFGAGSLYFNLSYQQSLDYLDWRGASGNLGFNLSW